MNDHRTVIDLLGLFEGPYQHWDIVTVNIADVFEAKLVYKCAGQDSRGDRIFHRFCSCSKSVADAWNALQGIADSLFPVVIALRLFDAVQITAQSSDGRSDRHLIVVQNNDQAGLQMPGLIYGLHRHSARKR